ncbi:MAG: SPOR domain-containing protein [Thermodesulfobacteriota bacterium]|nr:SPOR domain-containing protein [Thermodesulfobacteriota bacterium]
MHYDCECFPVRSFSDLKAIVLILSISLTSSLGGACTREEQAEVQKPVAVRSKIPGQQEPLLQGKPEKPPIKKASGVSEVVKTPAPEKKAQDPVTAGQAATGSTVMKKGAYYEVQKGDSLAGIAGRKDIYGDPMKWPSLFRLNRDSLNGMEVVKDFQHQELPEGLDLRFVTPSEASETLTELGHTIWVVNVLSSRNPTEIVPATITLIKKGFRVYVTKAMVNEAEWFRLRLGFFKERPDAVAAGKEIAIILDSADVWIVEIGKTERARFAGY